MTGFHGLHVTAGVIWLIVVWLAALFGKIPQRKCMTVELAGLYWHFVDLVWVLLFTIVYLM
jgi:heme/copper-type cytochrome/quinol oxidase subunit 3